MNCIKGGAGLIFSLSFFMVFFTGCMNPQGGTVYRQHTPEKSPGYHKQGPPPHAPAHGYRHKQANGYEMEYNSNAGAYVVLNIPETFFSDNLYIRVGADGTWYVSAALDNGWRVAAGYEVPEKLKTYKQKSKMKKGKGKKAKKQKKKYWD